VNDLAFSAEGDRLISAGADRSVRLWDVATGQELLALPGTEGPVGRVAVVAGPGGTRGVAVIDSAVRLWHVP
jgi:WD40 repeat protein